MSIYGGRRSLQLGLNVLIDNSCEGCNYHEYPYEFQNILINKDDPVVVINNDDELWEYIWKNKEDKMSVNYIELVPILIEAVKELSAEVEELKENA